MNKRGQGTGSRLIHAQRGRRRRGEHAGALSPGRPVNSRATVTAVGGALSAFGVSCQRQIVFDIIVQNQQFCKLLIYFLLRSGFAGLKRAGKGIGYIMNDGGH